MLEHPNCLNGDDMGVGKTIQAIGVINADTTIKTAIIVCPKSLKLNWKQELSRWLCRPLTVGIVNGSWPNTDIVVINYDIIGKYEKEIAARKWDACIGDEIHLIRNAKTIRSKKFKAIQARRNIRMTGTAIVNRPVEIYNIISDLADFGSFFSFAKRYANAQNNGYGWDFSGASHLEELQVLLRSRVMIRRLKREVLTELPPKIRQIIELEAETPEQRAAINRENTHESDTESKLAKLRANVELAKAESEQAYQDAVSNLRDATQVDFTEMARLRHDTAVSKIPAVVAHVQSILEDNEEKVLIGAHHHDVINGLMAELKEFNPVVLTGETKEIDRQAAVNRFQQDASCRVFVGSIQAAGVGITLTAAAIAVLAELDWVPGNVTQLEDRLLRIGQLKTVLIQHLVLQDSIDARMAKMLVEKQAVIDKALDAQITNDTSYPERPVSALPTASSDAVAPDAAIEYQPKNKAATAAETVDRLAAVAATLTPEMIIEIHRKLQILAAMDSDRANAKNGVGFNKIDSAIGHSLADAPRLTPRQAALAQKFLIKYRAQLGE
jgi:SWI/SNF-related matrix-associated actin-dependent regulator 1 of chromatin subfamily A